MVKSDVVVWLAKFISSSVILYAKYRSADRYGTSGLLSSAQDMVQPSFLSPNFLQDPTSLHLSFSRVNSCIQITYSVDVL